MNEDKVVYLGHAIYHCPEPTKKHAADRLWPPASSAMANPHTYSVSKLLSNPISTPLPSLRRSFTTRMMTTRFAVRLHLERGAASSSSPPVTATSRRNSERKRKAKVARAPRRLITISTSGSRWHGQWSCEYSFTLRELQLADLAEDGHEDSEVFLRLTVQKHAGFGFSVVGRILASLNRKCSCCFSSYCREIDTTFDVWVLPSSKNSEFELPEIGGNDPSVIYVKPGSEADLDSMVQDTIRLTATAKSTCSESCEKSTRVWQSTDGKKEYDRRWYKLLELRDAM